jgi:hypothetical protein
MGVSDPVRQFANGFFNEQEALGRKAGKEAGSNHCRFPYVEWKLSYG